MTGPEPKINRPTGRYNRYYRKILIAVDFVILNAVFFGVTMMNPDVELLHGRLVWLLLNLAYVPVARYQGRIHKIRALQMDRLLLLTLRGALCQALLFIFLLYLMGQEPLPLMTFVELYGLFTPLLMLWWGSAHYLLKTYRRSGRSFSRIVIVGCRPTAERLLTEMRLDPGFGYLCQGFFDIYCPPDFRYKNLYAGNLADLEEFVIREATDEIFYTLSGENSEAVQLVSGLCEKLMIKFHYVPQISPYLTRRFRLDAIGQMPVLEVRHNPLERGVNRVMKRTFDIVFSGLFLLFSPLIFIPVAVAVKLSSPGPVFFKQVRTGYRGRDFLCWKLSLIHI